MPASPVFILGAPRSGTSLLRDLLRSHPNLAFDHESHFVPRFYRAYGDPTSDGEAKRLAARILDTGWVRRWDLEIDPGSLAHHRSYAEVVAAIFERMARARGKARWGDKTPQYVTEIPTLIELFPDARIVHILRDGRDAALSWVKTGFGPGNLYTALTAWRAAVEAGRRDGDLLRPGAYTEIRFEELLDDPEGTMRAVCGFLDEPFDPAVLRPTALPRTTYWTLLGGRRYTRRPRPQEIVRSSPNWRAELSTADRALCERVAGELIRELGYETEGVVGSPPSRRRRLGWALENKARRLVSRLASRPAWPRTALIMLEARARERLRARRGHSPPRHA